jgi:streptogramin lyase
VNGIPSISGPIDIALAPNGSLWVANYGNATLSQYSATQSLLTGPVTGAGLSFPVKVAVDNAGNVWLLNNSNSNVSEFTAAGAPVQASAYRSSVFNAPEGLALDSSGNVWISNQFGNSLAQLIGGNTPPSSCPSPVLSSSTGCVKTTVTYSNNGLQKPSSIAVDGSGNLWVTSKQNATLLEFSSAGALLSNASGYSGSNMQEPIAIAIDASGNIWVANYGSNTITKFIGMAAPVATPKQGQPQAL